jgi:BirA family biotin operon repressor/biotin-[acetyl-CoA-carboxylase] ligase
MRALLSSEWQRFARCASTNDEAQQLARGGAPEGTVVVAAEQTAGRGRLGRRWHSPAGENLYLSVLLRPPLTPQRAPLLGLCAGLAMHRAAHEFFAAAPADRAPRLKLKWPNDLLGAAPGAPFAKLGGILTELVCVGARIDFVIIGVGCNVNGRAFPPDVVATSLRLLGESTDHPIFSQLDSKAAAIDRLGELFLVALADFYELYLTGGAPPIRQAFIRAAELGPQHPKVVVKSVKSAAAPDGTLTGVPIDLGAEGELILQTESGAIATILAGDVALAAPFAA